MATAAQEAAAEIKGVTNAIGKAQAVIEFNLDGTVITANDNFLGCLGYTLAEITGHHHRMFCEPAYAASGDYQAFWGKLNRGEFDAGVYTRVGKGGKDIWIQASYNPIVDANGKPYKVMEFSTDITVQKSQAAEFEGKINAINKAQAAIEFNMDGTVITANENFLGCLGYTLHEIKGQHHRLFCDPAYTSTGEYAAFWQKLNLGEFDAGAYRRIGKGGKEIWIQASYNPIVDANGKVYKVVKYATDITVQKKAQLEQEHLVGEAQQVLGALAEGDLTQQIAGTYQGELEKLKGSINRALANLTTTLTTVRAAAESVSTGAEQITKGNEDLSQRTSEQASSLEETSSAMEEMTSTVKQNADNAKQANQLAITARGIAEKGGLVTTKAIDAMEEINKSSKKIADIITVIDEIAFQTNLLALNAAVEAARAGEHGRGFAVVAAEVRNLAQRSATAAKEIKGLINESVQRVTDGSELVDQSGKTLAEIVGSVKRVTDIIAEITAASQEQASGIDQVNKAIMQMDETTQQNAALVEEATSASQSMKEQARELMNQVASFKLMQTGQEQSQRPSQAQASQKLGAVAAGPVKKAIFKKSPPKVEAKLESAAVGAVKGRKDGEFEEF
jgi:methyl-accepting chemotaxis protein